jgi:hypothetical protein
MITLSDLRKYHKQGLLHLRIDHYGKGQGVGVSVETAWAPRSWWEKIKRQMREAGFSYRSESPWFNVWKNGKWDWD